LWKFPELWTHLLWHLNRISMPSAAVMLTSSKITVELFWVGKYYCYYTNLLILTSVQRR
jgi:hypothetical protein